MSDDETSSSSNWEAPPAPAEGGMDVSAMGQSFEEFEQAERELGGERVVVKFVLPNGEEVTKDFLHGHTVQVLKVFLEDAHKLDYFAQVLKLGGKVLIDPLSLNDIKEFKPGGDVNVVEVTLKES